VVGSGKTTLTAVITSDHPQSYALPVSYFGRSRLPEPGKPGISVFELQSRIGFSSPELHAFFPKHLSARQVLESAWAETPLMKPKRTVETDNLVDTFLTWFQNEICPDLGPSRMLATEFERPLNSDPLLKSRRKFYPTEPDVPTSRRVTRSSGMSKRAKEMVEEIYSQEHELSWADERKFGSFSFPVQRLLLFLRAIVKKPDLVVLDEALSGMDPQLVQKCHLFLARGEHYMLRHNGNSRATYRIRRTDMSLLGRTTFDGLTKDQALVVIAHRKEEVPGSIRHWIALPEPGEGAPLFGVFNGPVQLDHNRWRAIWGLENKNSLNEMRKDALRRMSEPRKARLRAYWKKYSTAYNRKNPLRYQANQCLYKCRQLAGVVQGTLDLLRAPTEARLQLAYLDALRKEERKRLRSIAIRVASSSRFGQVAAQRANKTLAKIDRLNDQVLSKKTLAKRERRKTPEVTLLCAKVRLCIARLWSLCIETMGSIAITRQRRRERLAKKYIDLTG